MAGFGHENYEGRIPCPHCAGRDCAGLDSPDPKAARLICCVTGKGISDAALVRSARAHNLKRTA